MTYGVPANAAMTGPAGPGRVMIFFRGAGRAGTCHIFFAAPARPGRVIIFFAEAGWKGSCHNYFRGAGRPEDVP